MLHSTIEESFTPRHTGATPRTANGSHKWHQGREDDVQMSLLGPGERSSMFDDDALDAHEKPATGLSPKDKKAMALLILLYLIQGVPLGLALGSVPFLLREHLSYTQLGIFTLSSYPYSLKLFWSPIVDSVYSPKIGRRKSWIVPMQFVIGSMMLWISAYGMDYMKSPEGHINQLTVIWTSLVFFAATQDIAVDGWALTLISKENISYASTAQTIGLNCGYFLSFTVFLALNSIEFATKYGIPQLSLERYLQFWGFVCYAVTVWLLLFKTEASQSRLDSELNLKMVYSIMWRICKLKHVQSLCLLHLVCKIAFQANDAVTNLKLVEKGLGKEDLALAVLIDFPVQLVGGWLAATWAIGNRPLRPYLWAFWGRVFFAITALLLVYYFPALPIPASFFWLIVINGVLGSFGGTVQFVGVSAFHTRISDPIIGGTYMTLLNTASNLGGTWPRFFVLKGVDYFTIANCQAPPDKPGFVLKAATECVTEVGKSMCTEMGGKCVIEQDGYYSVSAICMVVGIVVWVAYVVPTALRLQALPIPKWHVRTSS